MKKLYYIIFTFLILCSSCNKKPNLTTILDNIFDCEKITMKNLEEIEDFKKLFTVKLPKNWKTNLYFDDGQSSIYGADTTKQLTASVLFDVSFIQKPIFFDDEFQLNLEREQLANNLIRTKSAMITINGEETYYSVAIGEKDAYNYQVLNYFLKTGNQNFIHVKSEIYGDSLVNERLCEAIHLIKKIRIQ